MSNPFCEIEKVILYITNELSKKEKKSFRKHAKTCKKCQQLFKEYSKLDDLLQTRILHKPSDTLIKKCVSVIQKYPHKPAYTKTKILWKLHNRIPRPVLQIAALLVVFLIGIYTGYSILSPKNNSAVNKTESKACPQEFSYFLIDVQTFLLMYENSYPEYTGHNTKTIDFATKLTGQARKVEKKLTDQELISMCREIEVLLNNIIFSEKTYTEQIREQIKKDITEKRLFTRINSII